MNSSNQVVVGTFTNLTAARNAETQLRTFLKDANVTLVENDQDETLASREVGHNHHQSSGISGFFARLFGFEDDEMPSQTAKSYFETSYNAKKHFLIVKGTEQIEAAQRILVEAGADIETEATQYYTEAYQEGFTGTSREGLTGATREDFTGTTQEAMELREEQLRTTKETVKAGEVSIRKEIVSEVKTIEVPVSHEEIVIERRALDGIAQPGEIDVSAMGEKEVIRIPVTEEQVRVEKQVVAKEKIMVAKKVVEETEVVSDTVKREEARIESEGRVTGKRSTRRDDLDAQAGI